MHQLFNKNKRLLSFLLLWMAILSGTGCLAARENLSDTTSVQAAAVEENPLGTVSTVYTDQLSKSLATTIIPSLTGRLPGLDIYQYRGIKAHAITSNTNWDLAGSLPDFNIGKYSDNTQFSISSRGVSPLVMIDGVQCELFSLDPEAIESVSLQKDALSSLQQGMRSARGLLVITTKQPDAGEFQLSFTGKYGMQQAVNRPKPLPAYQYAYLLNEALQNDGKNPVYSAADFNAFRNHTDPFVNPDVNWYDQTMKNSAAIQSYNLNASGGGKTAQYFVSLGYMNEEGLFRTSSANSYNTNLNYERYLITSKINVNVTDRFKVNLSLIGRIEDENQPGATADDILYFTYLTPNNAYPVRNPNGSYGGNISFPNNTWAKTVNSGYISDNARNALASINLKYDMGKWIRGLSAQADGSVFTESRSALTRNKQTTTYRYKPGEDGNDPTYDPFGVTVSQSNGFVSVSNYQYMYGQAGLNYERTVKQHALEAKLLADMQQATFNYNLPDRPANIYGKLKYNYSRKYFAEAAINRSYYNGYAPGKQWGTFYAFGLGWDMAKENFLSNVKYLDQLKFRGVYGKTGNGIDNSGYYIWRQSFTENATQLYPNGTSRTGGIVLYEINPLTNPDISWEKANKLNIGADIALFNNRLSLTADFYRDYYYDLLQSRGKSIELIGMSYPTENIGEALRNGLELALTYRDYVGAFHYYITANWSQERSELLYMDEQDYAGENCRHTGKPLTAIFGLVADGFFTSEEEIQSAPIVAGYDRKNIRPGDVKYKNLNGDNVIDQYDQALIGGDKPVSYFGLDLGFEYKGFEVSAMLQGVYNWDRYLYDATLMSGFQGVNQGYGQAYETVLNRWTPETAATATLPRLSAGGNEYNSQPNGLWTSLWIQSCNYIRLRNLNVGYTLPDALSRNYLAGLKIKLFVAGQNLWTKSAYAYGDPEVGFSSYPLMRTFYTGVNIKF